MADAEVKKRVVIASVLKPVNDSRTTEKIGRSLASTGKFDIHVIGYPSGENGANGHSVTMHPLPHFKRISFKRLIMSWVIRSKVITLRPDLLIIGTHELIIAGAIVKMVTGCKLIYDVQENYYRNIRHTNAFPPVIRNILAAYVRMKEWIFAPAFDHSFLAEKSYRDEMTFFGNRFSILENKVRRELCNPRSNRDRSKLLFSGTLSESTGVFVAIELATALHQLDPAITLDIVGYCSKADELKRIESRIEAHPFIKLHGGGKLVPHSDILKAIEQAGAGIISYPPNPSTCQSVPTKLFEYLGNTLPILLIDNRHWIDRSQEFNAVVVFNMQLLESKKVLQLLKNEHFYPKTPAGVYWESEESTLFKAVNQLI